MGRMITQVPKKKAVENEDPEADITNIGLLDDVSADNMTLMNNPVNNTIDNKPLRAGPSVAAEEEDDFPLLSLELKLERAAEIHEEQERERLQKLKKSRGFGAKIDLR